MRPLPGERVGASSVVPAGSPYARPTMSTATDLDGRVALVSGGARGLGRGITDGLLAAGARVAVCGRSQPDELPAGARFFGADVRDAGAVDGLVAAVAEHYGRLDIAVNDAGGSPVAEAATAAPAFSTAIVTLNLLAPLLVSQAVNRVMQGQDEGGAIVNIGSLTWPEPVTGDRGLRGGESRPGRPQPDVGRRMGAQGPRQLCVGRPHRHRRGRG